MEWVFITPVKQLGRSGNCCLCLNDLMYQCISNLPVFTGAQVLDSLLMFLMLMHILTYSGYCYENHTGSPRKIGRAHV